MTKHQESKAIEKKGSLLTAQDQTVCEQIAAGIAPHSQRAKALLVINAEGTAAVAAEQSGLSLRQVRYWLTRFKSQGVSIFTATQKKVASTAPAPKKAVKVAAPAVTEELNVAVEAEKVMKPSKKIEAKSTKEEKKAAKKAAKKADKVLKKEKKKVKVDKKKAKKADKKANKKDKARAKKDKKKGMKG